MKTEDIIHGLDKVKINIYYQRNKWDKLKKEINNIKPPINYGTETVDRAFVDMVASIDYLKFLIG